MNNTCRPSKKADGPALMIAKTGTAERLRLGLEVAQRDAVEQGSARVSGPRAGAIEDIAESLRTAGDNGEHAEPLRSFILIAFVEGNLPLPGVEGRGTLYRLAAVIDLDEEAEGFLARPGQLEGTVGKERLLAETERRRLSAQSCHDDFHDLRSAKSGPFAPKTDTLHESAIVVRAIATGR